ncbi:cysteine-rich CWC family protein [Paraburkholderia sp.]|uniref:cysteine-rich CWC family protein n=1 Tax=Paraburkholderia sp. TaxID=1926495 RepID=UPI0039E4D8E6
MNPSFTGSGRSARCPRCGIAFDCCMRTGAANCWCRELPPLPADRLDPASTCLCPECLTEEIARAARGEAGGDRS